MTSCARPLIAAAIFVLAPRIGVQAAPSTPKTTRPPASKPSSAQAQQVLGGLPLVFEPNLGQTDQRVRYLTRAPGMVSFLTDREHVMVLSRGTEQSVVRMKLEGSRAPYFFEGLEQAKGISNYLIGNDPAKWVANVPNYRKVRARGVYEGIDLLYYGNGRRLEYDFVVRPGADPSQIRLSYNGVSGLATDAEGNLLIATRHGTLVQRKPKVYQEFAGERREVAASYTLRRGKVEFALASWDRRRELVIDPVLVYSTYLGGSGNDLAQGIAVDSSGAAYVTGSTTSLDFPGASRIGAPGGTKVFVAKLDPSGALVYSTYIGGTSDDSAFGIAVDSNGAAYVAGRTLSEDFPTRNPYQAWSPSSLNNVFVTKLNATGNGLEYSTYLLGDGDDYASGIAVDLNGAAYVTGYTLSTNFPTTVGAFQTANGGVQDAFVAKLNPNLPGAASLVYSTYLGGSGADVGNAIAVDSSGAAYVTGDTGSTNFPTMNPFQAGRTGSLNDAFVVKLDPTGSALVYSTYLGGSSTDGGDAIAVDSIGAAYVVGDTSSGDFPGADPARRGGGQDLFVVKLNAAGNRLVYSTYLGGSGSEGDIGSKIGVDSAGVAYVAGSTSSTDLPTNDGSKLSGSYDIFVAKLNATGALVYSTYLGGTDVDRVRGIAVEPAGNTAYVAGFTFSTDLPAGRSTFQGNGDGFVAKLDLRSPEDGIAVVSGDPQSAAVGTGFGQPLKVRVTKNRGNGGDPLEGVPVTFTPIPNPTSGASATLTPPLPVPTDKDGEAFVNAMANMTVGTYTVRATCPVITQAETITVGNEHAGCDPGVTFTLTNTSALPATITFKTQPTNTPAGSPINAAQGVVVEVRDASNNPVSGASVTIALVSGTLNNATPQTTGSNGTATFTGLSINTIGAYQLIARVSGVPDAPSSLFKITAGAPISITPVSGGGQTAVAGAAFAAPLVAVVKDAFNNVVPNAQVIYTAPDSGATVTFADSATVPTNASGEATSPAMTASRQAGTLQVNATTSGATTQFNLTIVAGPANKLAFVQQPNNAAAGDPIAATVQLQDEFGNVKATEGVSVTLQLSPGQTLFGTTTRPTAANGLATFSDLNVHEVGQYRLLAEAGGVSSATSNPFTIRAGAPTTIQATGGTPQSTTVATPFAHPLEATVKDAFGHLVSGATVSFAAPGSSASAVLSSLTAVTDSSGRASVTATANANAGAYNVTAGTAGVAGTTSLSLTNLTGAPGQIGFTQQPTSTTAGATISPAVVVQVLDGSGNPVSGASVTLSVLGGTATLNGTVTRTTGANGQATFDDLSINRIGTFNLLAVTGSISSTSAPFTISPSTSAVVISAVEGDGQSAAIGTQYGGPLKALVEDHLHNPIGGASVTFAAPTSAASATFAGSATVMVTTDASGIATSPALSANSQTGAFQVTAATAGTDSKALFNLTNLAASGNRLAFLEQPTNAVADQTITPAVTVQLQDSSGNPMRTAGVAVAVQPNAVIQRRSLMSGNATQNTDANGLATFANLSISQAGRYELQASANNIASATSNPFVVTTGSPSSIVATGGATQSAFVLSVFGAPLQVTVTDAGGNPVSGIPVVFTAPASGPSGTLGGQLTVTANTDAQGRAQGVITANAIAGSYVVTATVTAAGGSASFSLTNLPLASTVLRFVQQPSNAAAGQAIAPPVTVQVQNSAGNPVNVAGVAIVMSLSSGTGTLLGTFVQLTDQTGTATFNDLSIGATGPKRLRAISGSAAPAESNSFTITAGNAAVIIAISGTPQATSNGQPFPALLQAQVSDAAGNRVNGASVTFTAPASGPGGTFGGPATVTTDANGIATAPILTANNTVGSFAVTGSAPGVASPAPFALTILPQPGALTVDPVQLTFMNEISQPAPASQTVRVTSNSTALTWTASSLAPWLTITPSSGTTPTQATVSVNPSGLAPGNYSGVITFISPGGGSTAVLVTYTIRNKPALVIAPPSLVFTTTSANITPPAQTLAATSSSRVIAYGVSAQVSSPSGGSWLQVSPAQGQTIGTVQVRVNPGGLSQGIYNGSVLFTPTDTSINSVAVPVTLLVACEQGGCGRPPATILALVNGASFHPGGAPGAAVTIFGVGLSDATYQAQTYPLPMQLGPTTVTVNGSLVPLYYVSPTQINFQMPFGAPAGAVQVAVNGGVTGVPSLRASQSHSAALTVVDPGLFLTSGNRAAALNQDLSVHTAATPLPAGALIVLYLTGQGAIAPPLADGTAAPSTPLSLIDGVVQVNIGGRPAEVVYAGVAPGFAGLAQINAIIPSGLIPGNQPAFVIINGISSNAGLISVR